MMENTLEAVRVPALRLDRAELGTLGYLTYAALYGPEPEELGGSFVTAKEMAENIIYHGRRQAIAAANTALKLLRTRYGLERTDLPGTDGIITDSISLKSGAKVAFDGDDGSTTVAVSKLTPFVKNETVEILRYLGYAASIAKDGSALLVGLRLPQADWWNAISYAADVAAETPDGVTRVSGAPSAAVARQLVDDDGSAGLLDDDGSDVFAEPDGAQAIHPSDLPGWNHGLGEHGCGPSLV